MLHRRITGGVLHGDRDIEVEDVVAEENSPDDPDEDETEDTTDEDAKDEEIVLIPKKKIPLDDDDDTGKDDEEGFEKLRSDIKEEIEKINNSDVNQGDSAENELNKNSVDCVQTVN